MSRHHRNLRVVCIHVHAEQSCPLAAVGGKGEPEEFRRVLLDLIKMAGYGVDTARHCLNRPCSDDRLNQDSEGHPHPCPSDSSFIVCASQPRNSASMCRRTPDEGITRLGKLIVLALGDISVYMRSRQKITYPAW